MIDKGKDEVWDALEDIIKKMEQICDTYAEAAKDIGMS